MNDTQNGMFDFVLCDTTLTHWCHVSIICGSRDVCAIQSLTITFVSDDNLNGLHVTFSVHLFQDRFRLVGTNSTGSCFRYWVFESVSGCMVGFFWVLTWPPN